MQWSWFFLAPLVFLIFFLVAVSDLAYWRRHYQLEIELYNDGHRKWSWLLEVIDQAATLPGLLVAVVFFTDILVVASARGIAYGDMNLGIYFFSGDGLSIVQWFVLLCLSLGILSSLSCWLVARVIEDADSKNWRDKLRRGIVFRQ